MELPSLPQYRYESLATITSSVPFDSIRVQRTRSHTFDLRKFHGSICVYEDPSVEFTSFCGLAYSYVIDASFATFTRYFSSNISGEDRIYRKVTPFHVKNIEYNSQINHDRNENAMKHLTLRID